MKVVIFTNTHLVDEIITVDGFLYGSEQNRDVRKLVYIILNSISKSTLDKVLDELIKAKEEIS